jgi:hypothetical protein
MDHDLIVEQLLARCNWFIETIFQASDLHPVATASLAIFAQIRPVARAMLQAKITVEAPQRKGTEVTPCCEHASVRSVHTRLVSPQPVVGEVCLPVRTFPCGGCGASLRPDEHHLGVPEGGDFTDDGRALYAPVVAERPQRIANALLPRCTGVALRARGAQSLSDSTTQDLQPWQAEGERQEAAGGVDTRASGDAATALRVEVARDGAWLTSTGAGRKRRWPPAACVGSKRRRRSPLAGRSARAAMVVSWARRRTWLSASPRSSARRAESTVPSGRSGAMGPRGFGRWRTPMFQGCVRPWTMLS